MTPEAGRTLIDVDIAIYKCPSRVEWEGFSNRRDYFGVVGGRELAGRGWRGCVFDNGTFVINKWNSLSDVTDGTSQTYGVGESVHPAKWGMGDGYGNPNVGGPVTWWHGAACPPSGGRCDVNSTSYGRCLRSMKYPLNASIMPMADNDSNDAPFGSDHPGGTQFCFVDGHVEFVSESIDFGVYQAGSTRSGNEVIDPGSVIPTTY